MQRTIRNPTKARTRVLGCLRIDPHFKFSLAGIKSHRKTNLFVSCLFHLLAQINLAWRGLYCELETRKFCKFPPPPPPLPLHSSLFCYLPLLASMENLCLRSWNSYKDFCENFQKKETISFVLQLKGDQTLFSDSLSWLIAFWNIWGKRRYSCLVSGISSVCRIAVFIPQILNCRSQWPCDLSHQMSIFESKSLGLQSHSSHGYTPPGFSVTVLVSVCQGLAMQWFLPTL